MFYSVHKAETDLRHRSLTALLYSLLTYGYCDKTYNRTTFMSLNVTSLNVRVYKRKSFKT
jgi:hypothetical protein